ncbi:MAG: triose-phosphate isomerase [Chloroflexi bacterium]|nr:MAG: triose-phosphate isomerase [Chloroflexota bacterium]
MARTPIVAGNWKMHLARGAARELLTTLRANLDGLQGVEVVVCPPSPWLGDAADLLRGSTLRVGAQNVYWESHGAFTGEVSAAMLAGTVDFAIIGHSERRHVFGETDEQTQRNLRAVIDLGMQPMLAVGELRAQREDGSTNDVLRRQLLAAFQDVDRLPEGFIVAYEPVWAIGTGLTATPEIAQATCADVRAILADRFDAATAEACRIQYGGSVNAENAAILAGQPDIDGLLVGGAALQAESFTAICKAAAGAAA